MLEMKLLYNIGTAEMQRESMSIMFSILLTRSYLVHLWLDSHNTSVVVPISWYQFWCPVLIAGYQLLLAGSPITVTCICTYVASPGPSQLSYLHPRGSLVPIPKLDTRMQLPIPGKLGTHMCITQTCYHASMYLNLPWVLSTL